MLANDNNAVNSDSENTSEDGDVCNTDEINGAFCRACLKSRNVVSPKHYILHACATRETNPKIAVALSNSTCVIHDCNNEVHKLSTLKGHRGQVIDCIFSRDNSSLIYTGSSDGTIKLWDLRSPDEPSITFTESSEEKSKKEFSCFDISPNGRLLSAGTNLVEGDAFIMFWDIRKTSLLGGYWESHTDDVTQVKFHPNDSNKLMSGATDGLINIFDLSQAREEDALSYTLNTTGFVEHLEWFMESNRDKISCITSTSEIQLWDTDGAEPYKHLRRGDICKEIMVPGSIYLVKSHKTQNGLLLLGGSNKGGQLRSLKFSKTGYHPAVCFAENQQIVRGSWFNENNGFLVTGGEKGILDIWNVNLTSF